MQIVTVVLMMVMVPFGDVGSDFACDGNDNIILDNVFSRSLRLTVRVKRNVTSRLRNYQIVNFCGMAHVPPISLVFYLRA